MPSPSRRLVIIVAIIAIVALVGVTVAGTIASLSSDETGIDSGSSADSLPSADEASLPDCPPPTSMNAEPTGSIQPGAVWARLCPEGQPGSGLTFQATPDGLGPEATDIFIEYLGNLPRAESDAPCPSDAGLTYRVVLAYPGDTTASLTGEMFGCRSIKMNGATYDGANEIWSTYSHLLHGQRAQAPAPGVSAELGCDNLPVSAVGLASVGMTDAVLCVWPDATMSSPAIEVPIPGELLQRINTELGANITESRTGDCVPVDRPAKVVATNGWGDRVEMQVDCTLSFQVDAGSWVPVETRDDLLALLDSAA